MPSARRAESTEEHAMGMMYKRGNVWWIKYYKNGKPYRESVKSIKETDAKRLLKKREGEISEGKQPGIYYDKILYDELAEDFVTDYRINGRRTLRDAERNVKLHLDPFFEGMSAPNVTTAKVKQYIEQRQPLVALCAHVHEGRGVDQIGRTLVINPGPITKGFAAEVIIDDTGKVNFHLLEI